MKFAWAQKEFSLKILAILISVLVLFGCSDGGGESGTGIQDTVVGPINGFGSVIVNGIKFESAGTNISIDGTPVSENNLSIGMVVKVSGKVNGTTGTASSISMEYEVKGLVLNTNINADGKGDMNVMGQTINLSADTKFSSDVPAITSIDQITTLQTVVRISGYSNGQGQIYATFVKVISNNGTADEVKVKGVVTNLTTNSFMIGSITINYDLGTEFEGISIDSLANGMYVKVESDIVFNSSNTTSFNAEKISKVSYEDEAGSNIEIEGVVTNTANIGNGEFELSGRLVRISSGTQYEGGGPENIQNDVKLEVEGSVQADGSVLAKEIEFRENSSIEISARVNAKTSNSVTLLGQTISVNELTSYEDDNDESNRDFNIAEIVVGDYLSVKVYVHPDAGNLIANSIRKDENQGETISSVEAEVLEVNGDIMTLVGMPSLQVNISGVSFVGGPGDEVEVRGEEYDELTSTLFADELAN